MRPLTTRTHHQEPGSRSDRAPINPAIGERHGRAVLTERRVRILRRRWKWRDPVYGINAFARRWGCSPYTIEAALRRRTWRHVA